MTFQNGDHIVNGIASFPQPGGNEISKFGYDCAVYRRTKREMLANGWDEAQIFGRNEVDVDTLILGFVDPAESQPVPTWAAKTVNKMLPTAAIPIRLASAFLLTKMMRVGLFGVPSHNDILIGTVVGVAKCGKYEFHAKMVDASCKARLFGL